MHRTGCENALHNKDKNSNRNNFVIIPCNLKSYMPNNKIKNWKKNLVALHLIEKTMFCWFKKTICLEF